MQRARQQGVALAIVVWFLAAMSLLVAGIVFQARVDIRLAQTHIAKAKAVAAGDGAIQLMLAALKSKQFKSFRGRGTPTMDFAVGELPVSVLLVPTSGLIDLNGASRELLAMLFAAHDNASGVDAQLMADNVIKWRAQGRRGPGQGLRFQSIEDLLQVEGMSRALLERVRDSVAVGQSKRAGVDWLSAPPSVLAILLGRDAARASEIVSERSGGFTANKTIPRGLSPRFQSSGSGSEYRVDAWVTVGDKIWLRRRWVSVGSGASGLLPWRFIRSEAARALPASRR